MQNFEVFVVKFLKLNFHFFFKQNQTEIESQKTKVNESLKRRHKKFVCTVFKAIKSLSIFNGFCWSAQQEWHKSDGYTLVYLKKINSNVENLAGNFRVLLKICMNFLKKWQFAANFKLSHRLLFQFQSFIKSA